MKIKNQKKSLQLLALLLFLPICYAIGNSNSMSIDVITPNSNNNVFEGCGSPYILIQRNGLSIGHDINFSITLSGSAQQDFDYEIEVEELMFNTIDASDNKILIPLNIISDGLSEPVETILVSVQPFCSGCQSSELTISVNDPLDLLAIEPVDTIYICPSDTLIINPQVINDFVALDYLWSTGSTLPVFIDPNPESGIVQLILSDDCGAQVVMDYIVQAIEVQAIMEPSTVIGCGSLETVELPVVFHGPGPYELLFSYNGILQDTLKNITESPFFLPVLGEGEYTLHYVSGDACGGVVSGSRNVLLSPFSVDLESSIVTCYGGNDGTASLHINVGTAPYAIVWENGVTDTLNVGLESGYHSVSLTDFAGCEFIDSIFVAQNPPIAFVVDIAQQPNCIDSSGGIITIPFECEPYTYEWNIETENSMLLDSLVVGSYIVVATNDLGCVLSDTIPLNGDFGLPNINLVGIDTLNCLDNFGNLEVAGLNINSYDFLWETSDGLITGNPYSNNIIVGVGGTYEVQVQNINNGCVDSSFIQVFEDFEYPIVNTAVFDTIDCYNGGVMVYGEGSSVGGDFQYEWSSFDGTISGSFDELNTEVAIGGLYTLSVINANNGCISASDLIVEDIIDNPDILLAADGALTCIDTFVNLDAAGSDNGPDFIYTWISESGNNMNVLDSSSVDVSLAGIYTLQIDDLDNGCSSEMSIEVLLDNEIPELLIEEPDFFSCINDSVLIQTAYLGNSNDLIYTWTYADSSLSAPGQELFIAYTPESINLEIEHMENGCTNSYIFDLVENYNTPDLHIQSQDELLDCALGSIQLHATNAVSGDFQYIWLGLEGQNIDFGQGTLNPEISQTGNYILQATDINSGCIDTDTIQIIGDTDSPVVDINAPDQLNCSLLSTIITLDTTGYTGLLLNWFSPSGGSFTSIDDHSIEVFAAGEYLVEVENPDNNCISVLTVEVEADTIAPEIILDSDFVIGCSEDFVPVDASNSSSGPSFVLDWEFSASLSIDSSNNYFASITEAGLYNLSILDLENFCESTLSFEIELDETVPTTELLPIPVINCLDSIVIAGLSFEDAYTYTWSTIDGVIEGVIDTSFVEVSAGGIYEVLVTDTSNGCYDMVQVLIEEDTILPIQALKPYDNLDCSTTESYLELDLSGSDPLVFNWSGPSGGISSGIDQHYIQVQEAGSYTVSVTNIQNNCIWESSYIVLEDVNYPLVQVNGIDTLTCYNQSIDLDVQTDSNTLYSILWTSPDLDDFEYSEVYSILVNIPSSYQVEVLNPLNGCKTIELIEVEGDLNAPELIDIEGGKLTCLMDNVWLEPSIVGSGNYAYSWSSTTGNILSPLTDSVILVDLAASYNLQVQNVENGCTTEAAYELEEDTQIPNAQLEDSYVLNCHQPILELDLSLDERIEALWFNASGTIIGTGAELIVFDEQGDYTIELLDTSNGCRSESSVELIDHNFKSMEIEVLQPICSDPYGSIAINEVIGSVEPLIYSINEMVSPNQQTDFDFLDSGDYLIEVEDKYGCKLSQEATVKPLPQLDLGIESSKLINEGDSYQVLVELNFDESEILDIQWTPDLDISCTDCLEPILFPEEQRLYSVELVTTDGCVVEHQLQVFVRDDRAVFTPNIFTPNGDGNNDQFMVYATDDYISVQAFKVFDRWGGEMFSNDSAQLNQAEDGWDGTFLGKEVQAAVYTWYLELVDKNGYIERFSGDVMLYR
jgi:gliding motility-associated-like protein